MGNKYKYQVYLFFLLLLWAYRQVLNSMGSVSVVLFDTQNIENRYLTSFFNLKDFKPKSIFILCQLTPYLCQLTHGLCQLTPPSVPVDPTLCASCTF